MQTYLPIFDINFFPNKNPNLPATYWLQTPAHKEGARESQRLAESLQYSQPKQKSDLVLPVERLCLHAPLPALKERVLLCSSPRSLEGER